MIDEEHWSEKNTAMKQMKTVTRYKIISWKNFMKQLSLSNKDPKKKNEDSEKWRGSGRWNRMWQKWEREMESTPQGAQRKQVLLKTHQGPWRTEKNEQNKWKQMKNLKGLERKKMIDVEDRQKIIGFS